MKAIKNTGVLLLSEVISKGIAFLLIPLYSYLVQPEDFGKIAILQLFFTVFVLFISFSLHSTFDKYYFDKKFGSVKSLFSTLLIIQLATIFFCSIAYIFTGEFLTTLFNIANKEYLDLMFYCAIGAIFFPIINSYLICSGQIKRAGYYSILISILRSVTALILVINMQDKILAILISLIVEQLAGLIIAVWYYIQNFRINLIQADKIRELVTYSALFFPTSLSVFIVKFSDRLMIQFMIGYQGVGIYSMGTRLVNIPGQFISTINKNFTPQIYESISSNNKEKLNQMIRLFLGTIFFLLFGLILFSKELFYVIGIEYKESFIIFLILCLCSYINGYNLIIQPIMTYYKEFVKYKSIIWVSVGVLNIILNLIFIPKYGIIGAAVVTTISYLLSIPFSYYYAIKAYKEKYYFKWFCGSLLVFVIITFYMVYSQHQQNFLEFIFRVIFFLGISYLFLHKLINFKEVFLKLKSILSKFSIKK